MQQLTIAIAGAGTRAEQHLHTLASLSDHYRVVAVSDVRASRAAAAAQRFAATAFADPLRMLDETRPDALFIVVPPDGHHALTIAAAERGIHVLCEVPISITLPLANQMISACRRAGVVLEICENVPRMPKERVKQEVVRRGLLGQILLARLQYTSGAYHGMSAVRRLLPGRATHVWGFRRILPALPQVEFSGLVQDTQDWECGFFSFGEATEGAGAEAPPEIARLLYEQPLRPGTRNSWEIVGTRGRVTDSDVHLLREGPDGRWREVTYPITYNTSPRPGGEALLRAVIATDPPVIWENPHASLALPAGQDDVARASQLLTFHRSIVEGGVPEYGADEARTDLELLIALRESARQGSVPIDLPLQELTGHERILHEEYRQTYGHDPLAPPETIAGAFYPRGGITHGVTHDRLSEVSWQRDGREER